jgi:hypothetical protein
MIAKIIDLLQSNDFHGVSKNVDIAKGKHEYITSFKDCNKKIKRLWLQKK